MPAKTILGTQLTKAQLLKAAETLPLRSLVAVLKRASQEYFNNPDSVTLTDAEFDYLVDVLAARDPNNDFLQRTGITDPKAKVSLPYYMPSLAKAKTAAALQAWLDQIPLKDTVLVSDKIDGVSVLITVTRGKYQLYTRGNGQQGRDISHLAKWLPLPPAPNRKIVLRGEIILPRAVLNKLANPSQDASKGFNLRNYVAGLVNRTRDESPELQSAHIIIYEVVTPSMTPEDQMVVIKALGFKAVPHKKFTRHALDFDTLDKLLLTRKGKAKYDVDGLVITHNAPYRRATSGFPSYSVAYKSAAGSASSDTADAVVQEIQWDVSRRGYIKPVIVIEPTPLSGVVIRRVTAHNAKTIWDNKLGPGAVIRIARSGDTIPTLVKVLQSASRPQMPKIKWVWNATRVDITLPYGELTTDSGPSNSAVAGMEVKQMVYFFSTLGVPNFKQGVAQMLYEAGYTDPDSVFKTKITDLVKIPGFGDKRARDLRTALDQIPRMASIDAIMEASGIFGRGLGRSRLSQIVPAMQENLPTWLRKPIPAARVIPIIQDVPGISSVLATQFAEKLPVFLDWYLTSPFKLQVPISQAPNATSKKLQDQFVAFTGFRDKSLENEIIQNSGTPQANLTKSTTILLVKDYNSGSSKEVEAKRRKLIILTPDDFRRKYLRG
jgi:DNA ligase (NAD+)